MLTATVHETAERIDTTGSGSATTWPGFGRLYTGHLDCGGGVGGGGVRTGVLGDRFRFTGEFLAAGTAPI
jgi:hypothetical protein